MTMTMKTEKYVSNNAENILNYRANSSKNGARNLLWAGVVLASVLALGGFSIYFLIFDNSASNNKVKDSNGESNNADVSTSPDPESDYESAYELNCVIVELANFDNGTDGQNNTLSNSTLDKYWTSWGEWTTDQGGLNRYRTRTACYVDSPEEEIEFEGGLYIGRAPASWYDAADDCGSRGGFLVMPYTMYEIGLLRVHYTNFWLGWSCLYTECLETYKNGPNAPTEEFLDPDLEGFWIAGEPNDYNGQESCIEYIESPKFNTDAFGMNDIPCYLERNYICQFE